MPQANVQSSKSRKQNSPRLQEKPVKLAKPPAPSYSVISQGIISEWREGKNFPSLRAPRSTTMSHHQVAAAKAESWGGWGGALCFASSPPGRTAQSMGETISPPPCSRSLTFQAGKKEKKKNIRPQDLKLPNNNSLSYKSVLTPKLSNWAGVGERMDLHILNSARVFKANLPGGCFRATNDDEITT